MRVSDIYERAMAGEKATFPWSENGKTNLIECYDADGILIGVFETLKDASEYTGINPCSISKNLNGLVPYASRKKKIKFKKESLS